MCVLLLLLLLSGAESRDEDALLLLTLYPPSPTHYRRSPARLRRFTADDVRFYSQADTGLCNSPMYAQFALSVVAAYLFKLGSAEAAAESHGRGPVAIRGALLWLGASATAAASSGMYAMQYAAQIAQGQKEQGGVTDYRAQTGSGDSSGGGGYYGFGPSWWAMTLVSGAIGALCGMRRLIIATSPPPPPPPTGPPSGPPPPPPPAGAPPAATELEMTSSQSGKGGKGPKGSRKSLLSAPMPASAAEDEDEPVDSTAITVAPQKGRVV